MLFQHAAEVIAVRESTVLRDLLDGLIRVAQEMAGAVEAIAQEYAHWCHSHLRAEEMIQVPDTDSGGTGGILRADAFREIGLEKIHRFRDAHVEFLIGPSPSRQFSQSMNYKGGGLPVVGFSFCGIE